MQTRGEEAVGATHLAPLAKADSEPPGFTSNVWPRPERRPRAPEPQSRRRGPAGLQGEGLPNQEEGSGSVAMRGLPRPCEVEKWAWGNSFACQLGPRLWLWG